MANETREIYRGKAVIMNVTLESSEDWKEWETRELDEIDKANSFKIVYDVAEGDANGARHDVKVEVSHRELKGKMLDYYKHEDGTMPTQIDVAVRTLATQGIIPRGSNEMVLVTNGADDGLCGREVYIRVYEELGVDGKKWWTKCVFASKARRLTGADKAARLAAFLSGKPAQKREDVPAAANTAIPAPSDGDGFDDMPF